MKSKSKMRGDKGKRSFGKKRDERNKPRAPHRPNKAAPRKKEAAESKPEAQTVVGIVIKDERGRWTLEVTDRREKRRFSIRPSQAETHAGALVSAKLTNYAKNGLQGLEILEQIGDPADPRVISLIALKAREIPIDFPEIVVKAAEESIPVTLGERTDLRTIPLVTIDGADARDFDDAVFAEKEGDGWHLLVAIADVAHYVKAASPLDREAFKRGNSTYFPDRVVPMLPEALSNGLCSLMPNVDRACMAVHMWLDKNGELERWEFVRGLMKSKARLTYEQVQAAHDGTPDETTTPLLKSVITPLYGAFASLLKARERRGTLELDLPERQVVLNKDGTVNTIKTRERLDSHRLIEEFMIAANVAAAMRLETKTGSLCLYRVHDKPTDLKLDGLRAFLKTLDITLAPGSDLQPQMLTQILVKTAGTPNAQVVNEMILRSQAKAVYDPTNIGHFGLALKNYAHFTSPIRRYADLIVHRGLIKVCALGDDGISPHEIDHLAEIGQHISMTERRSAEAEREVVDRFTALYLENKVGSVFEGQISGVAKFGLFVRLNESGADGIVSFNSLPNDYYAYDESRQAMVGQRHGRTYQLGTKVNVRLDEANRLTGSMSFAIIEDKDKDVKVQPQVRNRAKRSFDIRAQSPKLP